MSSKNNNSYSFFPRPKERTDAMEAENKNTCKLAITPRGKASMDRKDDTPLVSCVYIDSKQLGDAHRMSLVEFHVCSPGGG